MNAAAAGFAPDVRTGWFDWLRRELAPYPGRAAMTLRIVVTVVLVVIISMALQVPEALLSAYMVFFVTKENKVVTTLTGFLLMVGVTLAIVASLLIYRFTFDFPELRIPAIAAVLFAGFYLSRVFTIGPLAFGTGFVIAATQSIAELMPSAESLVHTLLWLWVAITYPIALTVVVNQVLLPAHPRATLVRELQRRLDATAKMIGQKLGLAAEDERARQALLDLAARGSSPLLKLLGLAEIADPRLKRRHAAQTAAILATGRLLTASAALALREREALSREDRRCLERLRAEAAGLGTALEEPSRMPPPAETGAVIATLPEIHELERAFVSLRESLRDETAGSDEPAASAKPRKRLFAADALTNPAHAHFGLKVALAAMACYILYTAVDWAGIHTAFITCCFISLENTGATLQKGALRFAGCAVGGLLGFLSIMYLIPRMESIASLALLIAAVTALAGWVAAGSERIAYAGLQIALAFYMCILQGFAPDTDFDKIRDRVMGILLGIAVTTLVFRYFWPERATDRLRETLALALRNLARLVSNPQPGTSLESATAEATRLSGDIAANLDKTLSLVEPTAFEYNESGTRNPVSASALEAIATRTQRIFLTTTFLTNEAALLDWQRLPEPVRRAEDELRSALAAQLDRAAASLTDAPQGEQIDLEARIAAWDRVTARSLSGTSNKNRAALLRRLATQSQALLTS